MRTFFLKMIIICTLMFSASAHAQLAGTLRFNTTQNRFEFYSGANWYLFSLGIGIAACTKRGALDFNNLLGVYRYCNGTVWVPIVGTATLTPCTKKGAMDFFSQSYHYCNGLVWVNMRGLLFS